MFKKIIWGIIGGTLWGIVFYATLAGLFIGINQNLFTIVSALFMGILWCTIISMIWKSLMGRKDESNKNYITVICYLLPAFIFILLFVVRNVA